MLSTYFWRALSGNEGRRGEVSAVAHQREYFRIPMHRSGQIRCGLRTLPCQVVNVSQKGVRLRVEGSFSPGDILQVAFALDEEEHISCRVQAVYVQPPFVGGVIVGISPHHQTWLSRFIDEVNTLTLPGI
jgi:PilZ domain